MTEPVAYPRHPAHLDPYIEVLGPELAVRFLIEFGGARMYFPEDPKGKSRAEAMIGADALRRIGQRLTSNRPDIPIANTWLVQAMTAEGKGTWEICNTLRITIKTVREARKARKDLPPQDTELSELPLFAAAKRSAKD